MRKFRLPTKAARETMTIEELEQTSKAYEQWYFMNEEGMTFDEADRAWDKKTALDEYIERRKRG